MGKKHKDKSSKSKKKKDKAGSVEAHETENIDSIEPEAETIEAAGVRWLSPG